MQLKRLYIILALLLIRSILLRRALLFSWDYVASLRFPFLRGPSTTEKQSGILLVQDPFFRTSPILMRAKLSTDRRHTKKAQSFDCALLFCRDSVGIRTQDPQLRRLLLYPTELPNRSLYFSKVAAKICYFFEICNLKVKVLLRVSIISTIPRGLF